MGNQSMLYFHLCVMRVTHLAYSVYILKVCYLFTPRSEFTRSALKARPQTYVFFFFLIFLAIDNYELSIFRRH